MSEEEEARKWVVEKIGPGGPVAWSGFDATGNYGVVYESGAETWLSRELLEDEGILNASEEQKP